MKKGLVSLILVAVLSLWLAGTTYAFSFSFHGKMWQTVGSTDNNATLPHSQKSGKTDFFSYNNALNTNGMKSSMYSVMSENESTTFGLTKARLRFEGKTDDGLAKIVYGLEVGTYTWGDTSNGFGLSGDGTNEETRFVYAEVAVPVIGGKVRAGLQPTKINTWVWTETAPGLTYHTDINGWKTMVGWYRGEDDKITNGGDNDYFVIKTNNKLNKNLNLGFFSILTNLDEDTTSASDAYDADYYYFGVNGKFNKGKLFGNFDAIYQGGEIDFENTSIEDLDRSAWLGDLTLGYKVTDKFKLSLNFLYVSGDDDPNDGDAENFDSIDVDVKIGTIFFKDTILADCDRTISDAPYLATHLRRDKPLKSSVLAA